MLDINGFLTSSPFLAQLATFITALLSAFFGRFFTTMFGGGV